MENNINLDAHSSLIIADGSIVEINGQKVLLTLVRNADAHETSEKGSELVGKWVRYNYAIYPSVSEFDSWCEVESVDKAREPWGNDTKFLIKPKKDKRFNSRFYSDYCFDLSNPLDYNPETLIGKYIGDAQIESIYYPNDKPCFHMNKGAKDVYCSDITPSDVTDTPPLPSLKYEDCFERVKPRFYLTAELVLSENKGTLHNDNVPTERQAKQLAATIKLMTIMHDANGGEWVPNEEGIIYEFYYNRKNKGIKLTSSICTIGNMIYFRDYETAQRAYEANKEIFHDYFGINE